MVFVSYTVKAVLLIFLSFLFFGKASADLTIQELTGVSEDAGEIISFRHLDEYFKIKISDYLVPELGIQVLDVEKLLKTADRMNTHIEVKEQSAFINEQGKVVEHLTGVSLDREKFLEKILEVVYSPHEDMDGMMLPLKLTPPRVHTQHLRQSMERRLSSFATYYNARNQNRAHNIHLASSSINYYVLLSGEVFSFNKIVGKRTMERGYKRAPVIVRGELSEGIGGGICQVSSTLFNAVDKAGLTILKRYSHSKQVGYVPPGRDATVSWYGPDFEFRNDYDHPVMIKSYAGNGVNAISIYSSKMLEAELREVPEAPKKLPKETNS